ncbi:MAG: cytochrome c oxidase subunit II [Planctomycetota bacterium]|nr:cytochrome c oxidase subunit II [Planctomycetota bacterium]MDA1113900.1 cytochrome c oxidase subunit II [Planctomycetota bacterium]
MIPVALLPTLLQHTQEDFWFPTQAARDASLVDELYYFIFYVSLFAFIAIVLATAIFAVKFRRSKVGLVPEDSPHHSTSIEIVWSVIPSLFMVAMFWYGFQDFVATKQIPDNAYEIQVKAKKWDWKFVYPEGVESFGGNIDMNDGGEGMVVPLGRTISVRMESADVLHSFSIPNFRVKMDVVPGRYTYLWFIPTELGEYPLYCTEYCGTRHSRMLGKVVVKSEEDYAVWLEDQVIDLATLPPAEAGFEVWKKNGCAACHSTAGVNGIGPFLNNRYGTTETLTDGTSVTVDDNYIRESILDPNVKVVAGFSPVMTSFAGQLNDDEISYLIAYLKSLNE